MSFPSPSLSVPSLSNYQFSFRGLKFGGLIEGAAYQLQKMPGGLDMPPTVTGDIQRSLDQGEFGGVDVVGGRDIEIEQVVQSDGVSFDHARQALGAVLGTPLGSKEEPLYIKLPSGTYACMAKPRKHKGPAIDIDWVLAGGGVAQSVLHATDPRWYAVPSKSATVGLPAPLGGVSFPISFPVSFGGGSTGGLLSVANNGSVECRPILTFTGPCVNPVATNLSIPGAPFLGFNITLAVGDTLVVETDFQSIIYTPAGASGGVSRRETKMAGSTWWNLPAETTSAVEFTTPDGSQVTGTLNVQSADAYMVL